MTHIELVDLYLTQLEAHHPNIQPIQQIDGYPCWPHLYWMLKQMRMMIRRDSNGVVIHESAIKFNRWLGFVQGALWWSAGSTFFTIEDFRNQTRDMTYS